LKTKFLWTISFIFSISIAGCVFAIWKNQVSHYRPNQSQLTTTEEVKTALKSYDHDVEHEGRFNIPTGLFIQSFYFEDSSSINITGYIWQKYTKGKHDHLQRGFIFPEAVETGSNIEPKKTYHKVYDSYEVIGWYFETTLRQNFDYTKYPFDHKQVWLRMWHKDFSDDVILVPDMEAYKKTDLKDLFGVEKDIVTGTWKVQETFFDYTLSSYDTDFGIESYVGQNDFPELRFNIVIQRKFLTAFVVNLLPLLVVISLLYAIVLSVTNDNKKSNFGSNFTSVIGALSGLFFLILLSHIQLRDEFSGGLVYMEYFYFVGYLIILITAISSYHFYNGKNWKFFPLQYEDNLLIKLVFWPAVLIAFLICTMFHF
jgi:hypothetical protein